MKNMATKQFVVTVLLIFALQGIILSYICVSFYSSSVEGIKNLGISNLKSQATMIENYLNKGGDVMWLAAETANFMLTKGESNEEILRYLEGTTAKMQAEFDSNFTGIYGNIRGEYIDGSGWTPPADFISTERTWYKEAVQNRGKMVISEPYIDAQTGDIVISFSQLLSDKKSVLALDIVLGKVQKNTENMSIGGEGYGFIINQKGLVVAHSDAKKKGEVYTENETWAKLLPKIFDDKIMEFEANIDGEFCTVFSERIAQDWYVVIVVSNTQLFQELRSQVTVGAILMLLMFSVIVAFCVVSARKINDAQEKERVSRLQIEEINANIIKALVSTIDAKDHYTGGHSQRVAKYATEIAKRMGKSEEEIEIIWRAGILHDIGKIRVPVEVINKKGKLNDEEFDQIRIHPVSGFLILKNIYDDERISYAAKFHHERYDGRGYPNGLAGENIPEVARIVAVADSYDAMASNRSYRKALPQEIVREEIAKGKGSQFDPAIADIMLQIMDDDINYTLCQDKDIVQNILIMDDDTDATEKLGQMLDETQNIKIYGADNLEAVYKILEIKRIDLMFIDLTDESLLSRVREKYKGPIVFMTSNKHAEILEKVRRLKLSDYITKPMHPVITVETVHGILN